MPDLARRSLAEELGVTDPVLTAAGFTLRLIDLPGQFLASGPPTPPGEVTGDDAAYAAWLAPGRRLVVGATPPADDFVSDVSEGYAVFEFAGARCWDMLAMGSPLDPAQLGPGRCARTLFAGVRVLVYPHGAALRLHVERPLARHLLAWFRTAATALG
jgi:sarcosine oxidase gamma subunit